MVKKRHHLYKRDKVWYFRKANVRFSLETTVLTEAERMRDQLLENYKIYGKFFLHEEVSEDELFGRVVKEWASIKEGKVKYSTWRDYRSAMNSHILPAFKDFPIKKIGYQHIEKFISRLNCGPKRINNILVPMRDVFKFAFKAGYVPENVMNKVDNLSVEIPDLFPFTHDEVLQIIQATEPFYKPYVKTRFYTGMRDGEINALLRSDYHPDMKPQPKVYISKAFVYGRDGQTKTKKSKRYIDCIPLAQDALEDQLKRMEGKTEYIFLTRNGDRMSPDHFRNVVWKPALAKAGFDYRPPIQTRHTFATMMLTAGEDVGWVQNMMGHSSLQMLFTRYYAWIPKKTRTDGSAFSNSVISEDSGNLTLEKTDDSVISEYDCNFPGKKSKVKKAEVIDLFGEKISQKRHNN